MNQKTIPCLLKKLTELEKSKQQVLEQETDLKAQLLEIMQNQNINILENAHIRVNYIAGFDRSSVNTDKLKKKYPDVAKDCIKIIEIDPFVKVTVL